MSNSFDTNRAIKLLLSQAKTLKNSAERTLNDSTTPAPSRYVTFKMYAEKYNSIARETEKVLGLPKNSFTVFETNQMRSYMDTLWGTQKQVVEAVALEAGMLITYLEDVTDFVEDEFENFSNFIKGSLRSSMFSAPEKEVEVSEEKKPADKAAEIELIVAFAADKGFAVTVEELGQEMAGSRELSDDEIESVVGGEWCMFSDYCVAAIRWGVCTVMVL